MNVAVIGAGNVGRALGDGWTRAGHDVVYGLRKPDETDLKGVKVMGIPEAVGHGEVVVLAIPYSAAEDLLKANQQLFSGKIVVDCTNPIGTGMVLSVGHTTSGAEKLAEACPKARIVKGFSTTGYENMVNPKYGDQGITMWICSDHAQAGETVKKLASDLGMAPVVTGPLSHARYLEPLAMLWIDMAIRRGFGRNFAIQFFPRP